MALSGELSKNRILAALPAQERDLLLPVLEMERVRLGDVLEETGRPIQYLRFPVDCAISVTNVQDREHMVEVTVTGNEGCTGSSVVQGSNRSPCMAMTQIGGAAIRASVSGVLDRLSRMRYLPAALARYNLLLLRHSVISVGCSQFHDAGQRLARWLLAHWHRTGLTSFPFTSDFLAAQAGVNPRVVTEVLDDYQRAGMVQRTRNTVTILDSDALTRRSCGCFLQAKESMEEYIGSLSEAARSSP